MSVSAYIIDGQGSSHPLGWTEQASQGSCTLRVLSGSCGGTGREISLVGFSPCWSCPCRWGEMEVLFFGWGGGFPRLDQARASQDSFCVPCGEKYKLCSGLGNGLCVIPGECSQIASCFR